MTGVLSRCSEYTPEGDGEIKGNRDGRPGRGPVKRYPADTSFAWPLSQSLGPRGSFPRRDGDGGGVRTEDQRSGGALNAALANELGKLIADFTGRGATRSRAVVNQDLVVCVFEDSATRAERNLVSAGKDELVRWQRDAMQRAMAPQLIDAVERLTGRRVRNFMSGTDESGGDSIEAFLLYSDASGGADPVDD
jgi:uncharacterized protein YbcI